MARKKKKYYTGLDTFSFVVRGVWPLCEKHNTKDRKRSVQPSHMIRDQATGWKFEWRKKKVISRYDIMAF